jgi:hypothetical protein
MSSIYDVLRTLEDGELAADVERELRSLCAELSDDAAERGGKSKGSITLKLGFELKDGVITISNALTTAKPKRARRSTVMWLTPDNDLTAKNPRQQELPLVDVNQRDKAARTV